SLLTRFNLYLQFLDVPGRYNVIFFFHAFAVHAPLHSFPTRRSSDLLGSANRHNPQNRLPAVRTSLKEDSCRTCDAVSWRGTVSPFGAVVPRSCCRKRRSKPPGLMRQDHLTLPPVCPRS